MNRIYLVLFCIVCFGKSIAQTIDKSKLFPPFIETKAPEKKIQIQKTEREQRESARGRKQNRFPMRSQNKCCRYGMQRFKANSPKGKAQSSHPNANSKWQSGGGRISSRTSGHGAISAK